MPREAGVAKVAGAATQFVLRLGVETIKGVPDTKEMIEEWADEAGRGYSVEQLRRPGRKPLGDRPGRVVPLRWDEGLVDAVDQRARGGPHPAF